MEKQVLAVLTELLEQQKEATGLLMGLNSTLNAMQAELENIEAKVDQNEIGNLQYPKTGTYDQLIEELNEVKKMLDNLPRNIRYEKRLLLFPEHNAQEYYSAVLKWVFFIIGATYVYWLIEYLITAFVG
jgi:hypothetical protein